MFKVLQVSTGYTDGEIEKKIIESANGRYNIIDSEDEKDIIEVGKDIDGLIVALTEVSRTLIESLPNLKVIVRAGIGVDNIDLIAAKENGIYVYNLPNYCQDEVADHTVALILAIERKIVNQINDLKLGQWNSPDTYNPIFGLKGRTVGFIGCGGIARKVIERLKPFGLNFIANDPYISEDLAISLGVELVEREKLITESDFISLHLPLNEETHHIISEETFSLMKSNSYIINTSRGPLIDNNALLNAIKSKRIQGAALDVIENDLEGVKLFKDFSNVIITPHTAYYSDIANYNIKKQAGEKMVEFINGDRSSSLSI